MLSVGGTAVMAMWLSTLMTAAGMACKLVCVCVSVPVPTFIHNGKRGNVT